MRKARQGDDPSREWAWQQMLDRLIDAYARTKPPRALAEIDPDLDQRLTVGDGGT